MTNKRSAADAGLELYQPAPKRVSLPRVLLEQTLVAEDGNAAHEATKTAASCSPLTVIPTSRVPSYEEFLQFEQERLAAEKLEREKYNEWARQELVNAMARIRSGITGEEIDTTTFNLFRDQMALFGLTITNSTSTSATTTIKHSCATQTDLADQALTSTQTMLPTTISFGTQTSAVTTAPGTTSSSWEAAYKKDLEHIRRRQPYAPSKNVRIVKTRLRPVLSKIAAKHPRSSPYTSASTAAPVRKQSPAPVILLDSDSDGGDNGDDYMPFVNSGSSSTRVGGSFIDGVLTYDGGEDFGGEDLGYDNRYGDDCNGDVYYAQAQQHDIGFYGFAGNGESADVDQLLRFQERDGSAARVPSVAEGHRLDMELYLHEINATHLRDPETRISKILEESSWGARAVRDEEAAIRNDWLEDAAYSLQRGFPLVEDVEFIVPNNRAEPDGDCYWRSMSFHLYGSDQRWDLVKAEHLAYLYYVLTHPAHPRYELYNNKLNRKFFQTASTAENGPFVANMWQVLHLAHAWTPALMQQVTADLYNICLITFTRDKDVITETAIRGSFNARHMFMLFVGNNHFQPMCTNHYPPSEFRYPRITTAATAKYSNAPKETSRKSTVEHPWRNDFTVSVPVPVSRLHGCDFEQLRQFLGSKPSS